MISFFGALTNQFSHIIHLYERFKGYIFIYLYSEIAYYMVFLVKMVIWELSNECLEMKVLTV